MYFTRAFWKKRPIGQVYRKESNVTSQTPVVSMTTRLLLIRVERHSWARDYTAYVSCFFNLQNVQPSKLNR